MGSKWLRLGTLGLLYFVQGAPYGFQASSLPVMMRKGGVSFTQLGLMKLLFLPWVVKPFYAPLIDNTMTKKFWLVLTMTALGLVCLATGSFIDVDDVLGLCVVLTLLNLFSAAQDIAVDSLAVRILNTNEEIGLGNTIQVVAYKAGSIFAGGILLMVQDYAGWSVMLYAFGSVYALCIALLLQLKLVEKATQSTPLEHNSTDPTPFFKVIREVYKAPGTVWMVAFLLFYKLCERAEMTFSMYLVDKQVTTARLAAWSSVMRTFSLIGSAYGGYKMSGSSTPKQIVVSYSIWRALAILLQFVLVRGWGNEPFAEDATFSYDWTMLHCGFLLQCAVLFCAGTITTATFSLMMSLSQNACRNAIQGTHYSTLATTEVLGKLAFATVAGYFLDTIGMEATFFLFVIFAFLTVPFIYFCPRHVASA